MNSIQCIKLGEVATAKGGSGFPEIYQGGNTGIPFIKVSDMNLVGNERFINRSNNYLEQHLIKRLNINVFPKDAIVFAKVGAALLLNRRRILASETAIDNNMMAVMCHGIDVNFLYHYLNSVDFEIFVQPGAVPSINQKHVHDLDIPKFTLDEQKKIAQILTSIDEKIESTEKLIEKKVSLRSGMLVNFFSQQSEELLGNIANVTMGQSPSSTTVSDNLEDGLPFLQGCAEFTRVHPKPLKSCFGEGKRASSKSVLISVRAPVGDTNIADREYVIGRGLAAIFPKVGITPDYLAFAIEFSKQKLNRVAQGSTFEAVGSRDILGLRINFHSDPSKRNKVSNILSSISGDIENNISLLEKLKLQKQGLMQDLLTGKVRVN